VEEYGTKNWKFIASQLKNKTPVQCLHRWNKILKPGLVKGPWTIEEDRKLLEWVNINGPLKWTSCSEFISGRSGKQCRERWFNTLNPNVKKGCWTPEEDYLIFKYFMENGSKWSLIASEFPGRTENSVKNRFYSTLRRISLDKKKILYNDKKNLENLANQINKNNLINTASINNNQENSVLNMSTYNCNINNPSSSLEELMKYFNHAFAEKTKIFLQYKKKRGEMINNSNINFDDPKELAKFDMRSLNVNDEISNGCNSVKNKNKKNSSKKDLKSLNGSEYYNTKPNNYNDNLLNLNKNNFAAINSFASFISDENLNEGNNKIFTSNFLSSNHIDLINNLNLKNKLLNKKRIRSDNGLLTKTNQINNTFNINFNINNPSLDNLNRIKSKKFESSKNENTSKISEGNKKSIIKKIQKIDDIEQIIENFNETSSKSNNQDSRNFAENESKYEFKIKKIPRFNISKNFLEKENTDVIKSKKYSISPKPEQIIDDEILSQENSNSEKEFIFKEPKICSEEEMTKLSINLIGNNSINQTPKRLNYQNYLYLEKEKYVKKTKSNQVNEKKEIFKFNALNDLYDQLNNLENILLNTKKQLFNLDKFFYKDNSNNHLDNHKSDSIEDPNCSQLPNNLEKINDNITMLNNKINTIKNLADDDSVKANQCKFITKKASTITDKPINCLLDNKNNYLSKIESDTLTYTENNKKEITNKINKIKINNNQSLIANQENIFSLYNLEKNPFIFQDDLPFMNIINNNGIKNGNVINSNILFNHFEGQLQEDEGFQFMENMFQI